MTLETFSALIGSNIGLILLVVAVFSFVVGLPLWVVLYRRLKGAASSGVASGTWKGAQSSVGGTVISPSHRAGHIRTREPAVEAATIQVTSGEEFTLMEVIKQERGRYPRRPLRVEFPQGDFNLAGPFRSVDNLSIEGLSSDLSLLRSSSEVPGLGFECAQNCKVSGFTIHGGVRCSQGNIIIQNCVLQNGDGCVGVEATNNSTVIFSGVIVSRHGGIAIRAAGRSRIILQEPYEIDDNDWVFLEPGCEIVC